MKHYINIYGENIEQLGHIESDESEDTVSSLESLKKKIADYIILNKIETIRTSYGGILGGTILPSAWAATIIETAIKENCDKVMEARKQWIPTE